MEAAKWEDTGQFFFQTYAPKTYSASPQNWAITQDARGILYVGNTEGLLEFDGVRWRKVAMPAAGAIRSLARDTNGRVYGGGQGEIGYVAAGEGGVAQFVSLTGKFKPEDRKFSDVWATLALAEGVYFGAFEQLTLVRPNGEVRTWKPETRFRRAFAVNGKLHVAQQDKGLYRMEGEELKLVPGGEVLGAAEVRGAVAEGGSVLYVGSRGLFRGYADRVEPVPMDPSVLGTDNTIYSVLPLPIDAVALGTTNGGLLIVDAAGKLLRRIQKTDGLPSNYIASMYRERNGGVWLATDRGVARWDTRLSSFDQSSGLGGAVLAIGQWRGQLYVGTNAGLSRMAVAGAKGGMQFEPVPGMSERVHVLFSQPGELWVGGESGLYRVKGEKAELVLPVGVVYDIHVSRSGDIYAVGAFGAVRLRELAAGKWEKAMELTSGGQEFRSVLEEDGEWIWISTQRGALHVRLVEGAAPPEMFGEKDGLPPGWRSFYRLGANVVVATEKGLKRFDARQKKFVDAADYGSEWGGERSVLLAKELSRGAVWLSGPGYHGILRRAKSSGRSWEAMPLLRAGLDEVWAVEETEDGALWAAGPSGVLVRLEATEMERQREFAVYLRKIERTEVSKLLYQGFGPVPSLRLPYGRGALRWEYAAPFPDEPGAVEYQVRLDGETEEWSPWSTETFHEYGNLWEGSYQFRVRARNPYGQESEEVGVPFVVEPPWFRTLWAYVLYALGAAGVVFGIVRWRGRALEASHRRLEAQLEERTTEIRRQRDQIQAEERKAEGLLLNLLPAPLAAEWKATGSVKPKLFDDVTVCFAEFVGFPAAKENLSAKELVAHLDEYFTAFDQIVAKHGLEKVKTMGGAYLFASGLPERREGHAVDAVLAALELQEKAKEIASRQTGIHWRLRVGLACGPVVAGVVGLKKFSYDLWGETVTLAERTESSGLPDRVNLSERMVEAVGDWIECEPRGLVRREDGQELPIYTAVGKKGPDWEKRYERAFGRLFA